MATGKEPNAAELLARCLENENVEFIFGIPGEENIHFVDALSRSPIRFILVRHEQGAAFMADMYGRLTGRAGVCIATLGPGAINLLLGVADAHADSAPLVAISAQVGLSRIYKESHQSVDLVAMFRPVTKWADMVLRPEAIPEMVRKAFKLAQTERPGAVYLAVPEDVEQLSIPRDAAPLAINVVYDMAPSASQVRRAAEVLKRAKSPVILAGHGAARNQAGNALVRFSERLSIPVATTFMGKGVFPDDHPNALGALGFMRHDYANFGFDRADVIVCVGYDLQEYAPERINPDARKQVIHIHRYPAEVDAHYHIAVGIEGNIAQSLDALASELEPAQGPPAASAVIRGLLRQELDRGAGDDSFPVKPQRLVADIRRAMGRDDIVLVDTGAVKMWMARLYPAYAANTCLISNGLATMGFALPGAIAAKLACPERKVLAVMGDGSFLMNSQELETAVREKIHFVALVWEDRAYGLIKWKMELELGRDSHCDFTNPDFVEYAQSLGVKGYRVRAAGELLPTLNRALADDAVSLVACPVDYSENLALTKKLGELTDPL
ncbi:MAG: acetolactate synthase large subunit [Candidatus Binatus sp.]|jgi:acetolactate synthase-1/2/3 large subunit|uniref:acetolactate synthase large subunit n=1 Tax=Candidatus Binatus sp. TaxID=2811406 RepID=UPI003CA5674D